MSISLHHEPLPDSVPKPSDDDPSAPERIGLLKKSPAYILPEEDDALLQKDELRAVRLQLEYLKTELALREHGVESTIVLFGGTRIVEAVAADRRVQALKKELEQQPDDPLLQRRLAIAERIRAKSKYYNVARELARIVSRVHQRDERKEFVIMTGGGPGIMEAGNRGAADEGAKSVGLNITLPMEQFPNPYITPELCFQFHYFGLRKLHFMMRARALVAFPGGFGTFDELFEAICLVQTKKIEPLPIILVSKDFWQNAFNPQFLADEGVISPQDINLFTYAETAEEIWSLINDWYQKNPNASL